MRNRIKGAAMSEHKLEFGDHGESEDDIESSFDIETYEVQDLRLHLRDKFRVGIDPLIKIYRLPGSSKEIEAINVYDLLTLIDQILSVEEL